MPGWNDGARHSRRRKRAACGDTRVLQERLNLGVALVSIPVIPDEIICHCRADGRGAAEQLAAAERRRHRNDRGVDRGGGQEFATDGDHIAACCTQ